MIAYALGLYEKALPPDLSWRQKLEAAKEAGYDFLEISIDETEEKLRRLDMSAASRLEIVRVMYEVGIPIRSMCLSGHRKYPLGSRNPEIIARGMEIMEKAVQLADDLGIRMIMLAGYDVYYEESDVDTAQRFAANLKTAVKSAARAGVLLAFETMETEFMNTVEKSLRQVVQIDSPYLQVYPDIGNITNAAVTYGKEVTDDLKGGKGHLAAMHLKETEPGKFRDMMYGEGHVDFEKAIDTAWNMGVRRYVAEFWYQGKGNWKEDLVYAHESMSRILDQKR